MFSPLARGKAGWDGGVELEECSDQTSPIEPLFPQLLSRTSPCNKSAKSTGSFALDDGQLALPKTFVTRKGAILLFTPSDDLCNHGNGESHFKKENVYEAGLKLRTLGNLTNSVLEFGKEDEEAWEGIEERPKETSQKESRQKRDKKLFLRFLHYLDSENLTADKHVQPGADPDYYLEELKKSSGHNSQRRFRSHTPFSTRTSYSGNTYSHFLEDDEEITGIIQDYVKYGRSVGWHQDKEHLEHGVVSSDHMPDVNNEGWRETSEDFTVFSSLKSSRINPNLGTFSPSMPSMSASSFYDVEDSTLRPKTAPIPPTLESPRANPRITSAKPPPAPRALGSTPSYLEEIINADVGFGRYQRQAPSPRRRISRSPSPSFHLSSSRGATPDLVKVQRLASPDGKSEDWNRTSHVIKEEDEASVPADQGGSGKSSRRPSSAGSLSSGNGEKVTVQRRVSSAGTANRRFRSSVHSSCSGSLSSVSNHYNRTLSAMSRNQEHFFPSPELDDMERDESSPTWPGMREEFSSFQDVLAESVDRNSIADPRTAFPARDSAMPPSRDDVMSPSRDSVMSPLCEGAIKSPSPPPRSPSLVSRMGSPSTRSPSVQSRRGMEARSRGSSAASSDANVQWEEAVKAADNIEERKSSSSSLHERAAVSHESDHRQEDSREETDTRTSSAKSVSGGAETKATLGSEADLAQVSQSVVRSQSVVKGLYEDLLAEEETADKEWPGVVADAKDSGPEEVNESDDSDSIAQDLAISSVDLRADGPPGGTFSPIPPPGTEESPDLAVSLQQASRPNTTECDENPRETPVIEVREDEAMTSSPLDLHENETAPLVALSPGWDKTDQAAVIEPEKPPPTDELVTTGAAESKVQDFTPSSSPLVPVPSDLPVNVPESKDIALSSAESPIKKLTEVPRASSPAPIKADQILHKELLAETGLQVEGKVDNRRPRSPYKETIDIEKSRPSSPVTEEQRNVPVSIGEAVRNYLETGKEPQVRERPWSRRGSETGAEEKENATKTAENIIDQTVEAKESVVQSKPEAAKSTINKQSKPAMSGLSEKSKDLSVSKRKAETKPDLPGLNLVNKEDKTKVLKEPTDEEREARRQMVSSLFSKRDSPTRGKLELEGIGKEGEDGEPSSEKLVTRTSPTTAEKKNDLSDLAALVAKNKTPSKPKEKKQEAKKKSGKPSKTAKKKSEIAIDPENIDFDAFNTPEMLDGMDDELRQFIQEQSRATTQPTDFAVVSKEVKRQESVQTLEVPQVAQDVPPEKRDAHAPSKPKKLSKKELTKLRADQRKEERKRKEEEKRLKDEEIRLSKEREEEAARAKAEAEEKQKNIEEEKMKRMAEEEEVRKQEEEALEKLKEAKKKAREERDARRAAEAERRRLEVQKKREEKKKREEELKEREKELEQQRMDREKRMAEIDEARRRKEELERLEEEQRREEERLRVLQEEEEDRRLEEEKIREAEEELRRIQEEREYREQMRRIAEMQEAKLRQEEEERRRREEEEHQQMEEERRKREEAEQKRIQEEQKRVEMARRLEALARMRSAQEAARRKALLLKRREDNVERMQNLKHTRCGQGVTRAFVFTYYTHIPRKVWEVPIGFNKKKKGGFGSPRRKPAPPKPP